MRPHDRLPRWLSFFLILGLFLTLRGYHSRDSDQAYRLPLLLHHQDPAVYADDPFVRAFDTFNPHRGYLALLDVASRPLGLSAGLFGLFVLTFVLTCTGLDWLAGAVWPEHGRAVGLVAIALALTAKAGNIGTIHVFEAMLLDRLMAFALGWLALGWIIGQPETKRLHAAIAIALAALLHPSIGVQLALLAGASAIAWPLASRVTEFSGRQAILTLAALGVGLVPWALVYLGQAAVLYPGLPAADFRLLTVELQGPQHMLPHLWRFPQWLAFGCYPVLALLALGQPGRWPAARVRLAIVLAVNLAGLLLGWLAIEVFHHLGVTVFQPFRMATVFRGLALVAASGRVLGLWNEGRFVPRRAGLLAVGLAGDWMLVVVTATELAVSLVAGRARLLPSQPRFTDEGAARQDSRRPWENESAVAVTAAGAALAVGLAFLARHDTESGHIPLLAALAIVLVVPRLLRGSPPGWNPRRLAWALAACWALPLAAWTAAGLADPKPRWAEALVERCRFAAVPTDDVERLAVWCRTHTPADARFIGPPGPKTFRLWSLRSVAFNRAASPYHARALADWAGRFRDHVGFEGSFAELVRAYQTDRHGLEQRYQSMSDAQRAALALRQGARYVVAAPPAARCPAPAEGPLELLHVEGRYAVYRVREPQVQVRTAAAASAGTG